jgi:hypothetical protein
MKLVHLVGFIIKKFITMHGHMNGGKRKKVLKLYVHPKYLPISRYREYITYSVPSLLLAINCAILYHSEQTYVSVFVATAPS